jgi:hypothetical protein
MSAPQDSAATDRQLRRLLWWCRLNAALFLTLMLGWVALHVLVQVPPTDEVQIALEVERPDAEGHIAHVVAACLPYSQVADSQASCLVAYTDHGSPRLRRLHFRHSGFDPYSWDTWGILDEETHS